MWLLPYTFLDHSLWGKPAATCKETQAVLYKGPHQEKPKPPANDQHRLTHCTEEEIEAKKVSDLPEFIQIRECLIYD